MTKIVDENGNINYNQALKDLKSFLYGRKGQVDSDFHFNDIRFYLKPRNILLVLHSFSIIPKLLSLWRDLGYRILHRYFQLNVIAVVNKLKEQAKLRRIKK